MPKHFYYALRRISRGIIAKKILNAGKQYTAVCHLQLQLKLLSFFIRPYLSYALDALDIMGVSQPAAAGY